ncbi:KTSC domain-containing protein [Sphingomonas sp. S2-65]|uniref:KTSC domain-containing protein n=1 Tax=Sphingomonas sp. S2-65 TaxID=2903960 RepID=UPI001F37E4D6|nr:KTSC domain-containing protein [Sphingomonas sp. S2-65]UYY58791.1 KTSC domain-containing protein [Sphingomonas sp. S2-65]
MPSSVILSWRYDEAAQRLDIVFVSGKHYSYHAVPPPIAREMQEARSKGRYFNQRIRDHFKFTEH